MTENDWLAERFEENRAHLNRVAYRMLGSASEAEDAVQEAWLRLSRTDAAAIQNLGGWLTTAVARVSLDLLRSRAARREDVWEDEGTTPASAPPAHDPVAQLEQEAQMAESVGLALLVVLDTLPPAERLAFVLHDTLGVPFEEIARIVGRTPAAARQLASRARRRVRGAPTASDAELAEQRKVADAFVTALRAGDFEALIAVLHPDLVVRADAATTRGAPSEVRGAAEWAKGAVKGARAAAAAPPALALVDGRVGAVAAVGRTLRVIRFGFEGGRIASIEILSDPETVRSLELGVLED